MRLQCGGQADKHWSRTKHSKQGFHYPVPRERPLFARTVFLAHPQISRVPVSSQGLVPMLLGEEGGGVGMNFGVLTQGFVHMLEAEES